MSDTPADPEKKIIIDEDWKAQVEAEKEAAKRRAGQTEGPPPQAAAVPHGPLPPPSLELLVSSFAMQAMMALGVIADRADPKPEVHLDEAKHFIDTIEMLQAKTEGNRTPEESAAIESVLHELRLTYVAVRQRAAATS